MAGPGNAIQTEPEPWHARIRDATDGRVLGSGVLLGGSLILTCAHVVADCEQVRLLVDFPFQAEQVFCGVSAVVETASEIDLCLLKLDVPQPVWWSAPLLAEPAAERDAEVFVYGHPQDGGASIWVKLAVMGPVAGGGVQLNGAPLVRPVVRGFSGAAVCAGKSNAVLGVVFQADWDHAQGMAWMIPVREIRKHLPVDDFVVDQPPEPTLGQLFRQVESKIDILRDAEVAVKRRQLASRLNSPMQELPQQSIRFRMELAGLRKQVADDPASVSAADPLRLADDVQQAMAELLARQRHREDSIDRPPVANARCRRPGCPGEIEETGFCNECARRPESRRFFQITIPEPTDYWDCFGLVRLPLLNFPDPRTRIIADPQVPEDERFCGRCNWAVGRSDERRPGLAKGFCPRCATRFSFIPSLPSGKRVARDRYHVLGYLARGGYGWIYLAQDTHLGNKLVALKALIDQQDQQAAEELQRELGYLTKLEHPNLVRALDYFYHQEPGDENPVGYIVMEYIDGVQLGELPEFQEQQSISSAEPRFAEIAAYGLEILEVCTYLHERKLLYTDMKPENVIRSRDRIKVVDLGGICAFDKTKSAVLTPGFHVPQAEIDQHGLSVRSDLYSVARTLEELSAWAVADTALRPSIEAFHSILDRALLPDRDQRFASAAEMADQLRGVLREMVSLHHHRPNHEPSSKFDLVSTLFDDGLGAAPPLETWTVAAETPPRFQLAGFGVPRPRRIALELPRPQIDPRDPHRNFLSRVSLTDPRRLTQQLPESAESRLLECRIRLSSDVDGAKRCLDQARRFSKVEQWRLDWHAALIALVREDVPRAGELFEQVHAMLPGETAPKVAVGLCWEQQGQFDDAMRYFRAAWWRDEKPAYAAFGQARILLRAGKRAEAAALLGEVPEFSRHYDPARIAAIHALTMDLTGCPEIGECHRPAGADFDKAVALLRALQLDDQAALQRLNTAVQVAALNWLCTAKPGERRYAANALLGDPGDAKTLRALLADSFKNLSEQATDLADHDSLVTLKNKIRPVTWW